MKKFALLCLASAALVLSPASHAKGKHAQGTVKLPHPMKIVFKNKDKLDLSKSQLKQIKTDIMEVFPPKIHEQMDKVRKLEKKLQMAVLKEHKTPKQLEEQLTRLSKMKLKLTRMHIRALNTLSGILNNTQWNQLQQMLRRKGKHHKQNKEQHDHSH